jgi:hypothetical protein
MAIRIDRAFAGVTPPSDSGGRFAPESLAETGERPALTRVARATERAFGRFQAAQADLTAAEVERGQSLRRLGSQAQESSRLIASAEQVLRERERRTELATLTARTSAAYRTGAAEILVRLDGERQADGGTLRGSAYVARYADEERKLVDRLVGGIEDVEFRERIGAGIEDHRATTIIAAQRRAAARHVDYNTGQLTRTLAELEDGAVNGTAEARTGALADGLNAIEDQRELLGDAAAERMKLAFRDTVGRNGIAADIDRDPAAALDGLRAGAYGGLLTDRATVEWTVRAEQAVETRNRAARQILADQVRNHLASVEATGKGIAGLRGEIGRFAPDLLAGFDAEVARAREYHGTMETVRWQAPDQVAATLAALEPRAGSETFVEDRQRFAQAVRAVEARQRALDDDPFAYAARHPQVKSQEANVALQKTLGVRAYSLLGRAAAAAAVDAFDRATPDLRVDLLAEWATAAGATGDADGHLPALARDLDRADLAEPAAVLLLHAGNPALPALARRLFAPGAPGATPEDDGAVAPGDRHAELRGALVGAGTAGLALADRVAGTVAALARSYAGEGRRDAEARAAAALLTPLFRRRLRALAGFLAADPAWAQPGRSPP